jgi:hypothetical protein
MDQVVECLSSKQEDRVQTPVPTKKEKEKQNPEQGLLTQATCVG